MFYRHNDGKLTILIVYVEDIILTGDDTIEMQNLRQRLAAEFEIKDLGNMRYFLGMEVARNKTVVSQRKYVIDLLRETGIIGCKPSETPIDQNAKLGVKEASDSTDRGRFQRLVGRLTYLSHTRPDIAFAKSRVSQFMHSPMEVHMEAVHRILRYLKGRGLFFKKAENRSIEAYADAD